MGLCFSIFLLWMNIVNNWWTLWRSFQLRDSKCFCFLYLCPSGLRWRSFSQPLRTSFLLHDVVSQKSDPARCSGDMMQHCPASHKAQTDVQYRAHAAIPQIAANLMSDFPALASAVPVGAESARLDADASWHLPCLNNHPEWVTVKRVIKGRIWGKI